MSSRFLCFVSRFTAGLLVTACLTTGKYPAAGLGYARWQDEGGVQEARPQPDASSLPVVLEDTFETDTRTDYEIPDGVAGRILWDEGQVTLKPPGAFSRHFNGSAWIEAELNWEVPQVSPENPLSVLELKLGFDVATPCLIVLQQTWRAHQTTTQVQVFDLVPGEDGQLTPRKLAEQTRPGALSSGVYRLSYRCGYLELFAPDDDRLVSVLLENGFSSVQQLDLQAVKQPHVLKRLVVAAKPWSLLDMKQAQARLMQVVTLQQALGKGEYLTIVEATDDILSLQDFYGGEHPQMVIILNFLAMAHKRYESFDKAEQLYRSAIAGAEEAFDRNDPTYAALENNLGELYRVTGQYESAETYFKHALEVRTARLGPEHAQVGESLNNLGILYMNLGRYVEARELIARGLTIRHDALGKNHTAYAESLNNMANLLSAMGEYRAAEPIYLEMVERFRDTVGESHPQFALGIRNLAGHYLNQGKYDQAEELLQQAHCIQTAVYGDMSLTAADTLAELASVKKAHLKAEEAHKLLLQVLNIQQTAAGKSHPQLASTLQDIGELMASQGNLAIAREHFGEARRILEGAFGKQHPAIAKNYSRLATVMRYQGELKQSLELERVALGIAEKRFGREDPAVAHYLLGIAWTQLALDNLDAAESTVKRASRISRLADAIDLQARIAQERGDYERAEALFLELLREAKSNAGEASPAFAACLNSLAYLYRLLGKHEFASDYYQRSLEISIAAGRDSHPNHAITLNNLGTLNHLLGNFQRAESELTLAREMFERMNMTQSSDYSMVLSNLSGLYADLGRFSDAVSVAKISLEIDRRVLGEKSLDYASGLRNFAQLNFKAGDLIHARRLFQRAGEIVTAQRSASHPEQIVILDGLILCDLAERELVSATRRVSTALEIAEVVFGVQHPKVADLLGKRALLRHLRGEAQRARADMEQALRTFEGSIGATNPQTSLWRSRLAALYHEQGDETVAMETYRKAAEDLLEKCNEAAVTQDDFRQVQMSQHFQPILQGLIAACLRSESESAREMAANIALAWKGSAFRRQRWLRTQQLSNTASEEIDALRELQRLSGEVSQLQLAVDENPTRSGIQERLRKLEKHRTDLMQELSQRSEAYQKLGQADAQTLRDLQEALPPKVVLIDFYEYATPGIFTLEETQEPANGMCALIVRSKGTPEWIRLDSRETIVQAIENWRSALLRQSTQSNALGRKVHRLLWEPLAESIEGADTVLISPDGALALVPWNALPGEKNGSYLIESVRIASISVPRLIPEVLQELNQTAPEQSRLIAVGDVDFFAPAHPVAVADGALASVGKSQLGSSKRVANTDARHAQYAAVRTRPGHTYRPLPGTQAEVSKIGELADANAIQSIQMLTGARANESTIKRLAPTSTILHLATHGFFAGPAQTLSPEDFDDSLRLQRRQRRTEVHPGLMSGIACAGANQPVSTLQTREDGILTALEVASLDLGNVDLAVLSACSTGLGQATQGEGMLSLQRAFQIAGAESTVASLWEVNDGTTLVLMTEFYRNLWERRMSKLDALREAQLWMLRNPQQVAALLATRGGEDEFADENQITFAAPKFWAAWVLAGDWR